MKDAKKEISPLFYFVIVSSVINSIYVVVGVLIIFGLQIIDDIGAVIIALIFLIKGPIVGFIAWIIYKEEDKRTTLKIIGMYHGRIIGLLVGMFLGLQIADVTGAIIGALTLYFLGRWTGNITAEKISNQFDKYVSISPKQENTPKSKPNIKSIYIIFTTSTLALVFVVLANLFYYFEFLSDIPSKWLNIFQLIVILLAIFSISSPWLIGKRLISRIQNNSSQKVINPENSITVIGMGLSVIPVAYGFILIVLGAKIPYIYVYAAISILAALIWRYQILKIKM